ncbi:Transmembrane osmosensor [Onygenales sp. PD_40]|nr:Transmembrane osmosensor [Onygenales sp. PD_40]KAK2776504.1 Transmembrane osmosensor [Emmonsiellopsis sp. PD_33]KAK2795276.1 Transmembrane osmosensor [Onygenales sp. PD_12]
MSFPAYWRGAVAQFDVDNILGDPFALITLSTAMIGWLLAFVTSVVVDIKGIYPNFAWWALAYMLVAIIGISVVIGSATSHIYSVAIVGYLPAGLALTSLAVNSLIYDEGSANQASAGGFILMAMVIIVWIFYFGSTSESTPRSFIDSMGPNKQHHSSYNNSKRNNFGGRPETTVSGNHAPQMYTSAQLNGFETSSPVSGYPPTGMGTEATAQTRFGGPTLGGSTTNLPNGNPTGGDQPNEVSQPTEYPYRAKAIYSYEANPDDANEISFAKHEILEVSDVSGRWWQAKKATGETGIAPSNYLILL